MKLLILTNQTPHHTYYVKKLLEYGYDITVILEKKRNKAAFETLHPFERERITIEKNHFFNGKDIMISELVKTREFTTVNEKDAISFALIENPDLVIVFGTGKIKPELILQFEDKIVNLHGGDPERYRGLDSHLWAIYHNDFSNLITTIHKLNPEFDDGDIILKAQIPIKKIKIHELQRNNTKLCVDLTLTVIGMIEKCGKIISCPQQKKGNYYSFMPLPLKEKCVKQFNKYIEQNYGI